jgi:hypothetical protein
MIPLSGAMEDVVDLCTLSARWCDRNRPDRSRFHQSRVPGAKCVWSIEREVNLDLLNKLFISGRADVDYMTLIAEHDRIESLCDAMLVLVSKEAQPMKAIALLHELAQAVDEHLATEDRLIYDRMWPSDDPTAQMNAKLFVENFALLTSDWAVYLTEWTDASIAADWVVFCEQSRSIIARVRDRVRHENELLYPAAFRAGHMTLKPVAPFDAMSR